MKNQTPGIQKKIEIARERAANSVDGFARPQNAEEIINEICRSVLNGPSGEALMDYLKSISTSVVMPASATDAELREREGMRRIVGILDTRRRSTPKGK